MAAAAEKKTHVVIVGAGIFGMSTALWMLRDGKYNVTVLDKCGILPAPDAASTDLNKIVRAGDYADPALAKLCLDAIDLWRLPEWKGTYHETGVFALSTSDEKDGLAFVDAAYKNCRDYGLDAQLVDGPNAIKSRYPSSVPTGSFGGRQGYFNPIGGWAEAGRAVDVGLKMVRQLGGTIRAGAEVTGLVKEGKEIKGVVLKSGEEVKSDLVVVAAGAWTPSLFASPGVASRFPDVIATGQSVGTIQLTPEEVETYSKIPVVFNLDDGWYCFPPNPDGLVKMAIHGAGVINPQPSTNGVSVPRTKLTPGAEDGAIPLEMLKRLRKGMAEVYPELAKKDFVTTRLCWYCDTVTGDWLIDYHPDYTNLVLATGGSGHAFKFAPVIGREILRVVERDPNPSYGERWAFYFDEKVVAAEGKEAAGDVSREGGETSKAGADVRAGMRKVLREEDLLKPQDLKAQA
ncbi:sarcosine oxidase [Kwoniella heveanensis BCC8398]|uniref:Sarcosine oxidase n=1 Tax=Kwoniella heveanensis BCC8398 TaxID=1296120 RepID=A0A1B9GPF1_9TREE|nr:sarcosine oxidase [Kwoniella heveanensis BCC8398]